MATGSLLWRGMIVGFFAGLICLIGVYFVGAEEGATSIIKGMYVHEFVHDSRHLLGFPCH